MMPHPLAVIRRQDDQRVFDQVAILECCENATDLGVEMLYVAIVAPPVVSPVFFVPITLEWLVA